MKLFIQYTTQLIYSFYILIFSVPFTGYSKEIWKPSSVSQIFREDSTCFYALNSPEQVRNISTYNKKGFILNIETISSYSGIFQIVYVNNSVLGFSGLETNGYSTSHQHFYNGLDVSTVIENGEQIFQEVHVYERPDKIINSIDKAQNVHFAESYKYEYLDDGGHDPSTESDGSCISYPSLGTKIYITTDHVKNRVRNLDSINVSIYSTQNNLLEEKFFPINRRIGWFETSEVINGLRFTKYQMDHMAIYTFPHKNENQMFPTVEFIILSD